MSDNKKELYDIFKKKFKQDDDVLKYKEAYNLAIKGYDEENIRYNNMDKKAGRFLSALTFIIGIYIYIFAYLKLFDIENFNNYLNNNDCLDIIRLILSIICFLLIIWDWFIFLTVMTMHRIQVFPVSEAIDFYEKENIVTIYYHMAKETAEAIKKNKIETDKRIDKLIKGYKLLFVSAFFIILLIIVSLLTK